MLVSFLTGLTLASFVFGQLGRLSFLGQEINIYFYEIIAAAVFALLFFR